MALTLNDAWALVGSGRYREAANLATRLLQVNPGHPGVLSCRAMSVWSMGGDVDLALRDMRKAIAAAPEAASLRHNFATILASTGALEEARAAFREAIRLNPNDAQAFFSLVQNQRNTEFDATAQHFETLLETGGLAQELREFAHFGLTKVFDDLGEHDKAMKHAHEANRLGKRPYDMAAERERLKNLRKLVDAQGLKIPEVQTAAPAPIFVLGMPRSGTTLVESVLARHPAVFAGGEDSLVLRAEQQLLKYLKRPAGEADLMLADAERPVLDKLANGIRQFYAQRMQKGQSHFTDKLPHNVDRIGLISLLFPGARIVHVRRHPLDIGLSNYFTRFYSGNGYSNDLSLIGEHIANVWESIALWSSIPGISVFDLRYEELIEKPEETGKALFDYAGLDFDPSYLDPEKDARNVLTASQWQVRQPLYKRSVARWRPYLEALSPMVAAMGGEKFVAQYEASDR